MAAPCQRRSHASIGRVYNRLVDAPPHSSATSYCCTRPSESGSHVPSPYHRRDNPCRILAVPLRLRKTIRNACFGDSSGRRFQPPCIRIPQVMDSDLRSGQLKKSTSAFRSHASPLSIGWVYIPRSAPKRSSESMTMTQLAKNRFPDNHSCHDFNPPTISGSISRSPQEPHDHHECPMSGANLPRSDEAHRPETSCNAPAQYSLAFQLSHVTARTTVVFVRWIGPE